MLMDRYGFSGDVQLLEEQFFSQWDQPAAGISDPWLPGDELTLSDEHCARLTSILHGGRRIGTSSAAACDRTIDTGTVEVFTAGLAIWPATLVEAWDRTVATNRHSDGDRWVRLLAIDRRVTSDDYVELQAPPERIMAVKQWWERTSGNDPVQLDPRVAKWVVPVTNRGVHDIAGAGIGMNWSFGPGPWLIQSHGCQGSVSKIQVVEGDLDEESLRTLIDAAWDWCQRPVVWTKIYWSEYGRGSFHIYPEETEDPYEIEVHPIEERLVACLTEYAPLWCCGGGAESTFDRWTDFEIDEFVQLIRCADVSAELSNHRMRWSEAPWLTLDVVRRCVEQMQSGEAPAT